MPKYPKKGDLIHKLYLEIDLQIKNKGTPSYTVANF